MWTQFACKASIWIISEIVLGFLGYDNLADCGESMLLISESLVLAAEYESEMKYATCGYQVRSV